MRKSSSIAIAACLLALAHLACGGGGGPPPPAPLTLVAVEPLVGTTAGGTIVTLRGSGYLAIEEEIASILFGSTAAPSWEVVSDNAIECVTPPGRVGNVNVRVISKDDGKVLLTGGFRYVAALLWVADGDDPDLANLYYVDLDSAQSGLIGPLGYVLTGLAVSPDGVLYGVEDGFPHRLMQVDAGLGSATPTGLLRDEATGQPYDVRDITFVGDRLIGRTSDDEMVEIDEVFGFVTVLQDLTPLVFGDGIAAAGLDVVHLAPFEEGHTLHRWNPVTFATTAGPLVTTDIEGTVDSMAYDDGALYVLDADPTSAKPARLLRVDPGTGQAVLVLELSPRARAVTADS